MRIVFGTRKSPLALHQTKLVCDRLAELFTEDEIEIISFSTQGDRQLDQTLPEIGGKGVFTKELEDAILSGKIDVAVHSLKDLPTQHQAELAVIPVLPREDSRDVLVAKNGWRFAELPTGAVVGTSSPRRQSQCRALRSDLKLLSIRGNIHTRISKVMDGPFDAIVLAAAGIIRANLADHISDWFTYEQMLPAPGQGCLAATVNLNNLPMIERLNQISDEITTMCVNAERMVLQLLQGGCSSPIGVLAECIDPNMQSFKITGRVLSVDGQVSITESAHGPDPLDLARHCAARLVRSGANTLISPSSTIDLERNDSQSSARPDNRSENN